MKVVLIAIPGILFLSFSISLTASAFVYFLPIEERTLSLMCWRGTSRYLTTFSEFEMKSMSESEMCEG